MKCKICNKEATNEYCELHEKAHESLFKKYDDWKKALEISWKEYLNEVMKNQYSGVWAKEVAQYLLKKGDKNYDKTS